jgi:prophage regulatory protein
MALKVKSDQDVTIVAARAIRMPETQARTGLSKTHIYRLIKSGLFPRPFKLSARAIAFLESDIELWLKTRYSTGQI